LPQLPEPIWRRRIESEYQQLATAGKDFFTANQDHTDYVFIIRGPGLVEERGGFVTRTDEHRVRLTVKREYPYAGGFDLAWQTPIFHPNIRQDGKVCIQLVNKWSASQTILSIMDALCQMLENPNPDSPLNYDAAQYFIEHPNALKGGVITQKPKKPRILGQS